MLYSKWGFLFLIFQFVLMKVSPCLSKSLTNIWFELTYIGIYKIKKRCWPICYVNWGSRWKLKSAEKTLDLLSRMRSTELTLAPTGCSKSKVLKVEVSFFFFFPILSFCSLIQQFTINNLTRITFCHLIVCHRIKDKHVYIKYLL